MDLLIDTTALNVKIGLAENGKILRAKEWESKQSLAENITQEIGMLLEGEGKKMKDIDSIIVHVGPGGFSTLRIGIVAANTLAYVLDKPLFGVKGEFSTLEELLNNPNREKTTFLRPVYRFPALVTPPKTSK